MDYPRTHWQTAQYPVTGPAKKAPTTQAVAHWSGSDNIPADKINWLRAMQSDYVRNRGYSLGYWWLVCQNGDSYQIRGPELNSAANNGDKVPGNANDWTAPILFDVRTNERLTPAAIATARRLWNSAGVFSRPMPHHALDATKCCGAPVTAQINAGELDNPPPPTLSPSYRSIAMAESFEFATATRWDTRGFGEPLPAGEYEVRLDESTGKVGACANVTITQAKVSGYATVWQGGRRPDRSALNFVAAQATANEVNVALAADGSFRIFISAPAHIIVDLAGYWLGGI